MENGTSFQPIPENNLPPLTQSLPSPPHHHHHRRHIRYATPENSIPPQFILETASNNQRSTASSHRGPRTISASPPPATLISSGPVHQAYETMSSPRAQSGQMSQASQTHDSILPPAVDGQDHDRMETDEEDDGSDGSDSEREIDTPEAESQDAEPTPGPAPPAEDEAMDTSPDHVPVDEPPPPEPPSQVNSEAHTNEAPGGSAGLHLVHVHVPSENLDAAHVVQTITVPGLLSNVSNEAGVRAPERASEGVSDARGESRRIEEEPDHLNEREAGGEEDEGDEDSEDSSDDEEHPYWVNLKEDTSTPDDRELKMMEESGNETSALDHEHWERLIYEPLDDPEYVPDAAGRISWTVKGVHGTAEKPNREKIMRSPSVLIGGYYWNIKYFPHGNDGTEQLSIYIECSPTPYEDADIQLEKVAASVNALGTTGDLGDVERSNQSSSIDSANREVDISSGSADTTRTPNGQETSMEEVPTSPKQSHAKASHSWGLAAQIGCVLYNPEEPRVNVYQRGCHRYYNDSSDWGWTRFHGPWDEIHKRQRFQRQALLRNDTLAFTAYIRTVRDDTKSLWWHPPKESPQWDSEAMTGVPPFECPMYQSSAMVAAVSAWMHLRPIRSLLRSIESSWYDSKRMRPTVEELQYFYENGESCGDFVSSEDHTVNLRNLVSILNFYGANIDSKVDVVRIWETLRRVLNYEASGLDSVEDGNELGADVFKDVLQLKQPDLLDNADASTKYPRRPQSGSHFPPETEPHSVQETLDRGLGGGKSAFRLWQSFEGQRQEPPTAPGALQIELHRQDFSGEARKWRKVTHQIKIDKTILFNETQYTLYGMIVHSGDLESNEYYSVIRPEGPGTRWVKYAGDNHDRKVTILTSKQAIEAHEGVGEMATGAAAVAYIVLYVRTEALPEILCTPFKRKIREGTTSPETKTSTAPKEEDMMDSNDHEPDVPVLVYEAEGFDAIEGYRGRGICDPWTLQNECRFVKRLLLPASTTISQVKERLDDSLSKTENPETSEIRLWPMNTFAVTEAGMSATSVRAFPSLLPFKSYCNKRLDEIGQYSGGCRFWMKVVDKVAVPNTEIPVSVSTSGADHAREQEARDAAIQAVMSSMAAADDQANESTQPTNGGSTEATDTEMAGTENTNPDAERQRRRRQQQLLYQMQQAQQQQQQLAAQQAQQRQQEAERNAQQLKETYVLVKVFDADTQSLRGMGSAIVKSESKIVEETKKLLKIDGSEAWDCYYERGTEIDSRDCVKAHETFESKCGGADGTIIIAQRRPSAANITLLEAEGKCTTPIAYFHYLQGQHNPSILRDKVLNSYFGANYEALSLKNGVPHGRGTIITLAGDAYTGNFVAGVKSGYGRMVYANGDTYTGDWKSGEPNGQGQMVYAKTGNIYTGGFKKRKRHGKGTMTFEVADEELQLCKICYESEMDALFYDCGHVVACEECARQVDQCPVCRKNVRAVVRIWRT